MTATGTDPARSDEIRPYPFPTLSPKDSIRQPERQVRTDLLRLREIAAGDGHGDAEAELLRDVPVEHGRGEVELCAGAGDGAADGGRWRADADVERVRRAGRDASIREGGEGGAVEEERQEAEAAGVHGERRTVLERRRQRRRAVHARCGESAHAEGATSLA